MNGQQRDLPDFSMLGSLGLAGNTFESLWGRKPDQSFVRNIAAQAKQLDSATLRKAIGDLESGKSWFVGGSSRDMIAHEIFRQELESRRPLVPGSGLLGGR